MLITKIISIFPGEFAFSSTSASNFCFIELENGRAARTDQITAKPGHIINHIISHNQFLVVLLVVLLLHYVPIAFLADYWLIMAYFMAGYMSWLIIWPFPVIVTWSARAAPPVLELDRAKLWSRRTRECELARKNACDFRDQRIKIDRSGQVRFKSSTSSLEVRTLYLLNFYNPHRISSTTTCQQINS